MPGSMIICVGFAVFIVGNYSAFHNYYKIRNQIHKMIEKSLSEQFDSITEKEMYQNKNEILELSKLLGPPMKLVRKKPVFYYYYWAISFVVGVALLLIPYLRNLK